MENQLTLVFHPGYVTIIYVEAETYDLINKYRKPLGF